MVALAGLTVIDLRTPGTVTRTLTACVVLSEVPVTVTRDVPAAVEGPTVIVMTEVPFAAIEAGLKLTVTPVGKPVADRETAEPKPAMAVIEMVAFPEPPGNTVTEVDDAESMKPGCDEPTKSLIRSVPLGLPHPVAKSNPTVAG